MEGKHQRSSISIPEGKITSYTQLDSVRKPLNCFHTEQITPLM